MKRLPLIFIALLLPAVISGQYYDTGQDPGSLKWMQIKTGRFRVIYPRTYGNAGAEFARSLDESLSRLGALYPEKKFRLPVIIHNYTTESNGYVAWAPSRMEIYPTPEQNAIPLGPNTQLTLHELTHVMQMESLNRGFTKAISVLAGQQAPGAVSALLPLWFLEGDAVFSESILSNSGRGRDPSFQKDLKALSVEKGRVYKYDKMINGSFRNFVPDFYQTGFEIMAWSYLKFDPALWKKALRTTANEPFLLNPVNLSLRENAHLTKKRLFNQTFDTLRSIWNSDVARSQSESYGMLNKVENKGYVSYYSPVLAGDDSIIAIQTSLTRPPVLVLIKPSTKAEKKLLQPGYGFPWYLSYAKGKVTWVEYRSDPRWQNRTWSVIRVLDINSKVSRQISHRSRFMSAAISPDGRFIAASENSVGNSNSLVILNASDGTVASRIRTPDNVYLQRPAWDETGRSVACISLSEKGEGVITYDMVKKSWISRIEPGTDNIQSVNLRNDSLFFVSSASGTDNIYIQKPDRKIVPLTRSRFGVSDLYLHDFTILFADYTSGGNKICYTTLPSPEAKEEIVNSGSSFLLNRFKPIRTETKISPPVTYTPVPYRKWLHLFRFHSWMPFYADITKVQSDPTSISPGLTLLSQNNLSTLISSFGYEYSDNRHKFHTDLRWMGWYFVLESRLDYGNAPYIEKFGQTTTNPATIASGYVFTNTLSLPLSFQGKAFSQYLNLSFESAYHNDYIYVKETNQFDAGQNEFTERIYFSNYRTTALRDIFPRWAQTFDLSHSSYPFDTDIYGDIYTARTAFYFPGLFRNNGLKLRIEAETQNPKKFILANRALYPRSYSDMASRELQFGSADYFFPLAYPDFNISGFFYLTRLRADLFYDLAYGTGNYYFRNTSSGKTEFHDYRETFNSYGAELMADFYLFRMPFLISSGVQASWRNPGEYPYLKFLFNINLFGMNIGKRKL